GVGGEEQQRGADRGEDGGGADQGGLDVVGRREVVEVAGLTARDQLSALRFGGPDRIEVGAVGVEVAQRAERGGGTQGVADRGRGEGGREALRECISDRGVDEGQVERGGRAAGAGERGGGEGRSRGVE